MSDERRKKIMMLDDEKFLLKLYRIKFEKSDYEVTTYYDVEDALRALRSGYHPDVILFDITMPGGRSGYEFIEAVQKEELGEDSIKIALTNEGKSGEKARIFQLGADAHLLKADYIPSEVVAAVNEMLEMKSDSDAFEK
jgi:CheY-like chemotaxis protein